MNTLLAISKVTDARRDVILASGLYHSFPWRHLSPSPWFRQSSRAKTDIGIPSYHPNPTRPPPPPTFSETLFEGRL